MTQRTVPHSESGVQRDTAIEQSGLDVGYVTVANTQTGDGQHHVAVQSSQVPADEQIPVIPSVHGDLYIPPEGAPVTIQQYGVDNFAVVGAPIPNVTTPDIEPGERVISHPLSEATVTFNADGTLDIHGDGVVRINDGSEGAITDVSATTTTDGDGHVTDVSLSVTRNSDVLL